MQPQILSGARTTISIGGMVVAAAFVANYNIDTSASEIMTIDNVFPGELAPDRIRVSMSLRVYRTPDNDPVQSTFAPGSGQANEAEQKIFSNAQYVYIEIKDNQDNTILHIPKAWIQSRSGSVSIGDFLTETWSISGIGYFASGDRPLF